jgi:copper chaperone CopZ
MKKPVFALAALAAALVPFTLSSAPAQQAATTQAAASEVAIIQVNGLVCDFCVQSIKRMAGRKPEIATTDVNLDQGRVTIRFRPGRTLDDAALRGLITNAGYAVVNISRERVG